MSKVLLALLALALAATARQDPLENLRQNLKKQTPEQSAKHTWAVLVAGSSTWSNYRHQADVCHAYQLLHTAGVPEEHIVVFMYDDIANNAMNPYPGMIFNDLITGVSQKVDVYEGVPHDYTGTSATADNLLKVLTGQATTGGSGKVLQSTEEDNVFFYYDDHGNSGLVAMPYGPRFYDYDLAQALNYMSENKMYKNFIIFMQACYSGSMFYKQNIPENVFAATSAPVVNSAYACHYDATLRTYIASCWPYGMMKEIEASGIDATFDKVLDYASEYAVNFSNTKPCQYGDVDLRKFTLREFFAPETSPEKTAVKSHKNVPIYDNTACPQYDVPYQIARRNYLHSHTKADYIELQRQIQIREKINRVLFKVMDAALTSVNSEAGYLKTAICETCDSSCECIAKCTDEGHSETECQNHCCVYGGCRGTNNAANSQCDVNLAAKFEEACAHINNDYITVAQRMLGRLCNYPGANVKAAYEAITDACNAY